MDSNMITASGQDPDGGDVTFLFETVEATPKKNEVHTGGKMK